MELIPQELRNRQRNIRSFTNKAYEFCDEIDTLTWDNQEHFLKFAEHFRNRIESLLEEIIKSIHQGYRV